MQLLKQSRKLFFIGVLALTSGLAFAGAGAILDVNEVNVKVAELLNRFNNELTAVKVTFAKLDTDELAVRDFKVSMQYKKEGKENTLDLQIPTISYQNPAGKDMPVIDAKVLLNLNLVSALGQDTLDQMAPATADLVKDFITDFAREYGDAAIIDAAIDDLQKDNDGHVVSLKFHLSGQLDLTKLPAGKPIDGEALKSATVVIEVTRTSATANLHVDMNPAYSAFSKDEIGLKELIEGLLNGDKKSFGQIEQTIDFLDGLSERIVNQKAKP